MYEENTNQQIVLSQSEYNPSNNNLRDLKIILILVTKEQFSTENMVAFYHGLNDNKTAKF